MRKTLVTAQKAKIQYQLAKNGQQVVFLRYPQNKYKNPDFTKTPIESSAIGIFHQVQTYVTIQDTSDSRMVRKQTPFIFGLWDDLSKVQLGDITNIAGIKYRVNDVVNVSDLSIAGDISLEVIK